MKPYSEVNVAVLYDFILHYSDEIVEKFVLLKGLNRQHFQHPECFYWKENNLMDYFDKYHILNVETMKHSITYRQKHMW